MPSTAALDGVSNRRLAMGGILVAVFLAALDQNLVGPVLPRIADDVAGGHLAAWVLTSYMLAGSVAIAVAGAVSDRIGRRAAFLTGIALFSLGSAVVAFSPGIVGLLLGRAVQGLGGGTIFPVAFASIADLFATGDRARASSSAAGVFGLASIAGPILGAWAADLGVIAGLAGWRWVFLVNVPLGIFAVTAIVGGLPATGPARRGAFDTKGAVALAVAITSTTFALAATAIDAGVVLAISVAVLAWILLRWIELAAVDPILPPSILNRPAVRASVLGSLVVGTAMFVPVFLTPLWVQAAGWNQSRAGVALMLMTLAIVLAVGASGRLVTRRGEARLIRAGFTVTAVGGVALAGGFALENYAWVLVGLVLCGAGIGLGLQLLIVAGQNAVPARDVGAPVVGYSLTSTDPFSS